MKKITLSAFIALLTVAAFAQVPQGISYQAIARNSMGHIVPSQNIGVRFSILDLTGTTILYQETHNTNTNNFGLFTLAIGKGSPVSGTFAAIDWAAAGDKYLRVEIAPTGGTNYTIQGITQLLAVPYALYSEKTRLIAGNGISISNGNTISSSYVAGPGISITGNVISASAMTNAWFLNGNSGTTSANFIGTTDNQPLNIRVNNIPRVSISESNVVGSNNISYILNGSQSAMATQPVNFSVFGKDINGSVFPVGISGYVGGMTWSPVGGANNTTGKIIRIAQWDNTTGPFKFYDFGMDQETDFYISAMGNSNVGGAFPRKMFQITSTSNVGINMDWADVPTANFHTKGTVRFEGVGTNNGLTRLLAVDANGNLSSRDVSSITGGTGFWIADVSGIRNNNASGHVGIGGASNSLHTLVVDMMESTADGRAVVKVSTNDSWQSYLRIDNTTSNKSFGIAVGGSANTATNYGVGQGNIGIVNGTIGSSTSTIPLVITSDNKVGVSASIGGSDNLPKSRLHVRDGDVYINDINSGVIMKSPNGQCWRMTVSNAGAPVFTAIACP